LNDEIDSLVDEINWKWSTASWRPIVYLKQQHSPLQMMSLHHLASFCMVTSLDDGMNLVAKEFVASRWDGDGVLILSRFTGAARELTSAVLVNPFAVDEVAAAIRQAVDMPEDDRRKRFHTMRAALAVNNVYGWAGKLLSALVPFEFRESAYPPAGRRHPCPLRDRGKPCFRNPPPRRLGQRLRRDLDSEAVETARRLPAGTALR
jgi:trehalose 6-phosphate synthase